MSDDEDCETVPQGSESPDCTPGKRKTRNKSKNMRCLKCNSVIDSIPAQIQCGILHGRTHDYCAETAGGFTADDLKKVRSKSNKAFMYVCLIRRPKMPQESSLLTNVATDQTIKLSQRKLK